MPFSEEQIGLLHQPLDRSVVATRKQGNFTLSYVEGWHVIAEANRIFGFDGWHRETLELKCVSERERKIGQQGAEGWGVTYIAKSAITICGIIRHGWGSGHGIDRDLGLAHESAVKEAETDAMKRAFMTFGWTFGLALYDKKQEHVANPGSAVRAAATPPQRPTDAPQGADMDKPVWTGPINKTALQGRARASVDELGQCTDSAMLAGYWQNKELQAALKQMQVDLPEFYTAVLEAKDLAKERCAEEDERRAIQGQG